MSGRIGRLSWEICSLSPNHGLVSNLLAAIVCLFRYQICAVPCGDSGFVVSTRHFRAGLWIIPSLAGLHCGCVLASPTGFAENQNASERIPATLTNSLKAPQMSATSFG